MKYLHSCFFLLMFCISYSQKKAAYFTSIIDTTSNSTIKLNALDSLTANYQNPENYKDFANYSEQFVVLAIQEKEYKRAMEKAMLSFYNIAYVLGQNNKALELIEKTEEHFFKVNDSVLIGKLFLKKGGAYFNKNIFDNAIIEYNKAINFIGNKDSLFVADAIYFKGQIYFEKGNYIKAIKNYTKAGAYYEALGDVDYMFQTQQSIITLYGTTGFTDKTIALREKQIQEKIKLKKTNSLLADYYNLSRNYSKKLNLKKEEYYLLKAESFINEKSSSYIKVNVYAQLAKFYANNDLKKAKIYLKKAYKIVKLLDGTVQEKISYTLADAYLLYKKEKHNLAKEKLTTILQLHENSLSVKQKIEIEKLLSSIYRALGNTNKELFYYKNYTKLQNSINSVQKINALNYYQALFENEQQEKEIAHREASIELLNKERKYKNNIIIIIIVSIILIGIITFLAFKKVNQKRKTQLREKYAQSLLLSQEAERKRISKDLHDSLGQTLLLINNEVEGCKAKTIKSLVSDAVEEVRTISNALRPFQLSQTTINKALENLIEQLDKAYKELYIFGDFDDIEGVLNDDQQINLYRIIQECLSNIIKHSKAASARVRLISKKHNLYLYIKDNGVGFDFNEKYKSLNSLGLKTIKERVRFLKGSLQVDSEINEGTSISIIIPKKI